MINLNKDIRNMNIDELFSYSDYLLDYIEKQENNSYLSEYININRYSKNEYIDRSEIHINHEKLDQDILKIRSENKYSYQMINKLLYNTDSNNKKFKNINDFKALINTFTNVDDLYTKKIDQNKKDLRRTDQD